MIALPFGFGTTAIQRFGPVNFCGAARYSRVVDVENIPFAIRVNGIEHRNGEARHRGLELCQRMRSAHRVPLVKESTFVEFCQSEGERLIAFHQENWTMKIGRA